MRRTTKVKRCKKIPSFEDPEDPKLKALQEELGEIFKKMTLKQQQTASARIEKIRRK
jgi:hypothetical protein